MSSWLQPVVVAAAVMIALWALLVVLAARLPAGLLKDLVGFLPACVTPSRSPRGESTRTRTRDPGTVQWWQMKHPGAGNGSVPLR